MSITFYAGQKARASDFNNLIPLVAEKAFDENVISSTTLQDDNELFLMLAVGAKYWLDLALLATETTGTTADLKIAWTMPTGCRLDAPAIGAHTSWTGSAAAQEVEFNSWQAETSSPTSTRSFGTINAGVVFGYHVRGVVRNGANAGLLTLQWAQNAAVAENVTVKAGSTLMLRRYS